MASALSLALRARDLNNARLAELCGCSEAWISYLARGLGRPSPELAKKISDVVGLPEETLFGATDKVVVEFVTRSTEQSGTPYSLEDPDVAEQLAEMFKRAAP